MKISSDIKQKHHEIFYPTTRVRTRKSGGSGTVVYSREYKDKVYTYIITNHHIIADNIEVKKKWNPTLKKKIDTETLSTVSVEFFKYNNYSHCIGSFAVEADIVAYSEHEGGQDWALLRTRDKETVYPYVANIFPIEELSNIHIFDKVYACGASLGHNPVATHGHISYMTDEIENFSYWMSTAQTIFGNSGGAVFRWSNRRSKYEYIGIPSRIAIQPMGFSADAITHMGYLIPIDRIYELLRENEYQFIYDDVYDIEKCEQIRKQKAKAIMNKVKEDSDDDIDFEC